jgi:oligopeptide/dipeptide ABC transporter ATP-binding protein
MPLLQVEQLAVGFSTEDGVVRAVAGIDFALAPGEILGVVGESGSGKSVAMLALMGLLPTPPAQIAGTAWLDGRNLIALRGAARRAIRGRVLGMIFQDPMTSLNPYLTLGRQMTEAYEYHYQKRPSVARKRAIELLDQVGISDADARLASYPHQLSGGQRQRVMIAMALMLEPRLLIADEPTTALDVTIQAQILELLKRVRHETGTTMILITHDLGVVAGLTDRIQVMYAGRLVETGSTAAVFAAPAHPYTRGLLASVPRLDTRREALVPIAGNPPDLLALPPGCAFHPRCAEMLPRCREQRPALTAIGVNGSNQCAACWLHDNATVAPVDGDA